MVTKKVVLFGAGKYGLRALKEIGKDKVAFFTDNDEKLSGLELEGIEIKKFEQHFDLIRKNYNVVISVSDKYYGQIEKNLKEKNITAYYSLSRYLLESKYCVADFGKYKAAYSGKSCFLIGSGPSLRMEDLNTLQERGAICFAANKIFKTFGQTKWRPDYYLATDRRILNFYQKEIADLSLPEIFIAYYADRDMQQFYDIVNKKKQVKIFSIKESANKDSMDFSMNPSNCIIEGRTVMYAMMQICAFMGFSNMYLLGVDFSYNDSSGYDKEQNDHFCKDYISPGETVLITPKEASLRTFKSAEKISYNLGFRIYNATRGGKLEVFERVEFDKLMENMNENT